MATPEYEAYLTKLSSYLSANRFQVSRDVSVRGYKVDLTGVRETFRFSFFSAPRKQFVCFVSFQPNVNLTTAKTFTESSEWIARENYPPTALNVAQLVFPVMVSPRFDREVISFVESFEPKFLSREIARFPHPVLVELGTKSVYHRKGAMMGAMGYKKPMNQFVQKALSP